MFVDKATIHVKGGNGGNGCSSFRRETFVPKGGPNGGDGGPGGDVILETSTGEQSLVDLVFNRHFSGERGVHGKGKDQHGRKGRSVHIRVPLGTVIRDVATREVLADLDQANMKFIVAKGGRGGRGNMRFASSVNRAPRECEAGFPGEERDIELELKTVADVGLVGYPNAGKSTLLGAISHAHPKIAPYPFTTLHPVVGVIEFHDFARLTVADIPGLIDGAHDNIGLGHAFLRHIERTHLLAYVLDVPGVDGRNPWEDFAALQNELELYMKGLSKRAGLVIANKMDLPGAEENLELLKAALPPELPVIALSAATDEDFSELKNFLRTRIAEAHGGDDKLIFRFQT